LCLITELGGQQYADAPYSRQVLSGKPFLKLQYFYINETINYIVKNNKNTACTSKVAISKLPEF